MSASDLNRDLSAEAHARHIGTAILYINTDGTWSIGKMGQKISEYKPIKFNGQAGLHDDTFEFTAISAEARTEGGYLLYLRSNANPGQFVEAVVDDSGSITTGKILTTEEIYAAETKWKVDLNGNGGLGNEMVLVDAGKVNLFIDGVGNYQIQQTDKSFKPLTFGGQNLSQELLVKGGFEIESVVPKQGGGYQIYVRDADGNVLELGTESSGEVQAQTLQVLNSTQVAAAEATTGEDLNGKGDTAAAAGWTSTLKTAAIRTEVETQTANGNKITHAGLVKIVNTAIQAAGGTNNKIGEDVFNDLKAIAARGKDLFTHKDLSGNESGYLSYVLDKLVNGSKANSFYTGGATQKQNLDNLSADSTADTLQKLENKWLLGLDMPNPNTQGDTANPNATAASGTYKAFDAELVAGGPAAFDVNQGSAGTCYLLASIASIAKVSPESFNGTFVSNGTGANGAPTWGVRFFDTKGNVHWVTVNNQLAVRNPDDTDAAYTKVKGVDAQGQPTKELWAPLIEKAYAQANELDIFGRQKAENAMFAIEGGLAEAVVNVAGGKVTTFTDSVTVYNGNDILKTSVVPEGSTALAEYTKALNSGKVVFVVSMANSKDAGGATLLTSGHAFMAFDADPNSSTNTTVKVYNPWGVSARTEATPNPSFISTFDSDLVTLVGTEGVSFWIGV
ncbi:MAG: hypothetical protein RLZZ612_1546 [Pseudomonadota bacterium]|jgi:hypothetical protein